MENFFAPFYSFIRFIFFTNYITVTIQISKGPDKLVSFTIGKIAYQLGETVSGTFDFSNSAVPCYQVCTLFPLLPILSSLYPSLYPSSLSPSSLLPISLLPISLLPISLLPISLLLLHHTTSLKYGRFWYAWNQKKS
jgi:hypothetical protein